MESIFRNRIITLIVVAGGLIAVSLVFADKIKNFSYNQSFDIQHAIWQMAGSLSFVSQDQPNANKELIEENQKLVSTLAELQITKEENKFLKNAMDLGMAKEHKLIEAEVFGGGRFDGKNFSYEDSILINQGKNDGVQKGFSVVTSGRILVGKVSEVYDDFSRVTIITDKNSLVDIQIINEAKMETLIVPVEKEVDISANNEDSQNQETEVIETKTVTKETKSSEKIIAIAKGEGNFKISLDMFPKDKDLDDGAIVMTCSLSGNYPAGYVVGRIKNPKKIDTETFKEAEIIPAFDPKLLDKVFILKNVNIVKND
ncbi:MAG: rod shape-determining protein MreC [Candidatus Paceibacterota bacterium]